MRWRSREAMRKFVVSLPEEFTVHEAFDLFSKKRYVSLGSLRQKLDRMPGLVRKPRTRVYRRVKSDVCICHDRTFRNRSGRINHERFVGKPRPVTTKTEVSAHQEHPEGHRMMHPMKVLKVERQTLTTGRVTQASEVPTNEARVEVRQDDNHRAE